MEMLNLSLPANSRFASEYLAQTPNILQYFHYPYQDAASYKKRLKELKSRSFSRIELAQFIEQYMEPYPSSEQVKHSIQKLKNEDSVVVIGGQQAGILTGPLYTIHKVISIISFAKQKEEELGVPVVPVFWIAGEDHDFLEVNHIFAEVNEKMEKLTYPEEAQGKKMISDVCIDKQRCLTWVNEIIESFGETEHTNQLLRFAKQAVERSDTMVDFFANIIMELFKEFGLLIIDSGDKKLRKLEQEILMNQINNFEQITKSVLSQQTEIAKSGFERSLEISNTAANIFYYEESSQSRILLEYDPFSNSFVGKNGFITFTFEQLINAVTEHPERFSNNVVTRPLTQEMLFPTIAFIAGPGEIAYWSELKLVFEHFNLKLPPIVPRLNITLLERSIETDMKELDFDLEEIIREGIQAKRSEFINTVKDQELTNQFEQMKQELNKYYSVISKKTGIIDRGLLPLVEKNKGQLFNQIKFMEDRIDGAIQLRHMITLRKMERVQNSLRPNGAPQERILNPIYFLNKYGLDFVKQLTSLNFQFDGSHKIIKI